MKVESLFFSKAYLQDSSLSTPAVTLNPSSLRPWVKPPTPQNRSTTFIFRKLRTLAVFMPVSIKQIEKKLEGLALVENNELSFIRQDQCWVNECTTSPIR